MRMDHGTTWARVRNKTTGDGGWLNLQTEEVIPDHEMRALLTATQQGVVIGDPSKSRRWIAAENDICGARGWSDR